MAGAVTVDTIQSGLSTPTVFKNTSGTEIGQLCRAWCTFVGSTGAVQTSFYISSVSRTGTGQYTVNIASSLADANFTLAGSCRAGDSVGNAPVSVVEQNSSSGFSSSTATIWTASVNNGGARVIFDSGLACVSINR